MEVLAVHDPCDGPFHSFHCRSHCAPSLPFAGHLDLPSSDHHHRSVRPCTGRLVVLPQDPFAFLASVADAVGVVAVVVAAAVDGDDQVPCGSRPWDQGHCAPS